MFLGGLNLIYNGWRVRSYAFETMEAMQQDEVVIAHNRMDVTIVAPQVGSRTPFGIRAIESGIEIEGVWISPSPSPQSSRDSSPAASKNLRTPYVSGISQSSLGKAEMEGSTHPSETTSVLSPRLQSRERAEASIPRGHTSHSLTEDQHGTQRSLRGSHKECIRGRSLPRDILILEDQLDVGLGLADHYPPVPGK